MSPAEDDVRRDRELAHDLCSICRDVAGEYERVWHCLRPGRGDLEFLVAAICRRVRHHERENVVRSMIINVEFWHAETQGAQGSVLRARARTALRAHARKLVRALSEET